MCSEPTVHFQFCLHKFVNIAHIYRPQRSWGKVIFLYLSVILFTGGVCLSACWDTPPDQAGTPWDQAGNPPPQTRCPWDQASPGTRQAPPDQTPRGPGTPPEQSILRDTVNERAVCILLECNLVLLTIYLHDIFNASI